jgi:hypothetical protein
MGQGKTEYEFTADGSGLSAAVENLTLATDHGDVVFKGPLSGGGSMKYGKGILTSEEEIGYFVIKGAKGSIGGRNTDLTKMVNAVRAPAFAAGKSLLEINRFRETIALSDLDSYMVDTGVNYGKGRPVSHAATTKELVASAVEVLLESRMDATIYNNDTFLASEEDGAFLVLVTNGALQGFRMIDLKAGMPASSAHVRFSFTCTVAGAESPNGPICTSPEIIEKGKKITYEEAAKSSPVFLKALKKHGLMNWDEVD